MGKHGKTKTHKAQHFVPACYLKAWLDPAAPVGPKATPYVWKFDRDGTNARNKAPAKIFTETDIYTVDGAGGVRDLRIEHGLGKIETKFAHVRTTKLSKEKPVSIEERQWLCAFVATAQFRTAANRDHWSSQFGRLREMCESVQSSFEAATPEERATMARRAMPSSSDRGVPVDIEELKGLERKPLPVLLAPMLKVALPIFEKMHAAVLCTSDPVGFVTSDNPCTWFDPESYKQPPMFRGPALGSRTIQVTLPLSPKQCLVLSHHEHLAGYFDATPEQVLELNHRHIWHCDEHFISCSSQTNPAWFEKVVMPADSWEKVNAKEDGSWEWSRDD